MKLEQNICNITARNAVLFGRLKDEFADFIKEVESMTVGRNSMPITVLKFDTDLAIETTFIGTTVRYQMWPAFDDQLRMIGKIYVTRQSHRFSDDIEVLGVVTFDQTGMSDVEDTGSNDCYSLSGCTDLLVSHFFHEAILKPVCLTGNNLTT